MPLSPEATEAVQTELKRFAADLNLSEDQKTRLKTALGSATSGLHDDRLARGIMILDLKPGDTVHWLSIAEVASSRMRSAA